MWLSAAVGHADRPLLVAASIYFYAAFRASYVVLLLGVTIAAYLSGLAVGTSIDQRRKQAILMASVIGLLGVLFVFKYFDFFTRSIAAVLGSSESTRWIPILPRLELIVPVGLSFYTFSCISYLADVYAGRIAAERHLGYFTLYVSFFPKLLAGPIEREDEFGPREDWSSIWTGTALPNAYWHNTMGLKGFLDPYRRVREC